MSSVCEFCRGTNTVPHSVVSVVLGRVICEFCYKERVFVFGSNLAGRHGKGAALEALKRYGAKYGQGVGLFGRSYALPTKDHNLKPLPLRKVQVYATQFVNFALEHPEKVFFLTRVGCGLARNLDANMAPMFAGVPPNVIVPEEWRQYIDRPSASNSESAG